MNKHKRAKPGRTSGPKHNEAWTMSVPRAGKIYFGLGRDASYVAAKTGQIPVLRIGGRILAIVPALERMLAQGGTKPAA
jgi:hypothetical protein